MVDRTLSSASNALALVVLLGERGSIRVTEAAKELGTAPSTAHRLLSVLCRWGFALQDEDRSYTAGPALLRCALASTSSEAFERLVSSHLRHLAEQVGETTHLVVLNGQSARFVNSAEGPGALRVASRMGVLLPAHCTSGGKALLAELSDDEVRARYPAGLPDTMGSKLRSVDDLVHELKVVRRRKYAVNDEESELGISAVGVALHHPGTQPVAAVSISVPSIRFRRERVPSLVEALRHTASKLSETL